MQKSQKLPENPNEVDTRFLDPLEPFVAIVAVTDNMCAHSQLSLRQVVRHAESLGLPITFRLEKRQDICFPQQLPKELGDRARRAGELSSLGANFH